MSTNGTQQVFPFKEPNDVTDTPPLEDESNGDEDDDEFEDDDSDDDDSDDGS